MRVFVLTSCVGTKKYSEEDVKHVLEKHNLPMPRCDLENEEKYRLVLKNFILPASQMYQGSFESIRDMVCRYRSKGDRVELKIISARYGLIDEEASIIPYDCTFRHLGLNKIRSQGEKLMIYEDLLKFLKSDEFYESVVVLGKDYLLTVFDRKRSINIFRHFNTKRLVVFGTKTFRKEIEFPAECLEFIPVRGIGDRNRKIREFNDRVFGAIPRNGLTMGRGRSVH